MLKRRLLKSCLEFAILAEMSQRTIVSVPHIITFFEKNFNIHISPGTIYPVFKKLEKKKHIKRVAHNTKTLYVLTISGKTELLKIQQDMNELRCLIYDLLIKEKSNAVF